MREKRLFDDVAAVAMPVEAFAISFVGEQPEAITIRAIATRRVVATQSRRSRTPYGTSPRVFKFGEPSKNVLKHSTMLAIFCLRKDLSLDKV